MGNLRYWVHSDRFCYYDAYASNVFKIMQKGSNVTNGNNQNKEIIYGTYTTLGPDPFK